MVRECRPPAREPARSWLARRSTTATSTPANANSPASISPVGPPPAITTACSVIDSPPAGATASRRRHGLGAGQDALGAGEVGAIDHLAPEAQRAGVGVGGEQLHDLLRLRDLF